MAKNKSYTFRAKLYSPMEGKGWTFLDLPADSAERLGKKGRVPVRGTINGFAFSSSVMPTGNGNHELMVNATMRDGAKAKSGDTVNVAIEIDDAPRTVETPSDLKKALAKKKAAQTKWNALAYSHKKEYVRWLDEAKKAETRAARVEKAVARIAEGLTQR